MSSVVVLVLVLVLVSVLVLVLVSVLVLVLVLVLGKYFYHCYYCRHHSKLCIAFNYMK